MIRIVAPNIISYDVKRVFDKIDLDQDGRISRKEAEIMLSDQKEKDQKLTRDKSNFKDRINHFKTMPKGIKPEPDKDESTKETFTLKRKNSKLESSGDRNMLFGKNVEPPK